MKKNKIKRFPFLLVFTVCIVSAFAFLMAITNSNITNLIATDPNTEFNITYDLKDGKFEENTTAPTKYKYIEETSIPNPVKDGSEFLGWTINDVAGLEPIKDYKIPKGTSGDIKLTANWKVLQVKLMDGKTFNDTIKRMSDFYNVTKIQFVKGTPNQSGTDVSEAQDRSIMASIEGDVLTVASENTIYANENSANTFFGAEYYYIESYIESIDLSNFDTSNVTDMESMFYGCNSLTSIKGLENFDTSQVTNMSQMFYDCAKIRTLNVSNFDTSNVANMSDMFSMCDLLSDIKGLENFNTSQVTTMESMFYGCDSLTSLNLSNWNTSNVIRAGSMFSFCSGLRTIDLSNWNTSNLKVIASMFDKCKNLETIKGLNNFDTSNTTHFGYMFQDCNKLSASMTIANPNVSEQYGYGDMFLNCSTISPAKFVVNYTSGCKSVAQNMVATKGSGNVVLGGMPSTLVDGSTFNSTIKGISGFRNVTEIRFEQKSGTLSGTDVSEAKDGSIKARISGKILYVEANGEIFANKDCSSMFYYCESLTNLDLRNFDTSKVTDMSYMFYWCRLLTSLDLSGFDTSKVTDMKYMFSGCNKLSGSITIMNPNVTSYSGMFNNYCSTDPNAKFIVKYVDEATKKVATEMVATKSTNSNVYLDGTQPATLMSGGQFNSTIKKMNGFSNVTEIRFIKGTPNPNGTNVAIEGEAKAYIEGNVLTVASEKTIFANEDCDRMFYDCSSLTSIDVSNFDTSKVTTMYKMFNYCEKLTSIDVSNFNTSKVTNMWGMFSECYSLTSIKGLENFNTSQVTSMNNMFSSCRSLTSLDASNFDTSQVTIMYYMFNSCRSLTSIKGLENFDTSKVTNMNNMFNSCGKLSGEITISNPNITEYSYMFTNSSTDSSAKFVVNYTSGCQSVAKAMVATKDSGSTVGNVVLGTQKSLLSEDTPNDEDPSVPDTVVLTIKDGNTVTTKEILAGEIGSLNTPSKEGMIFSGYFYDAEFTKPVSERDVLAENTTIYVKWEEVPQVEEIPQEENKDESLEIA